MTTPHLPTLAAKAAELCQTNFVQHEIMNAREMNRQVILAALHSAATEAPEAERDMVKVGDDWVVRGSDAHRDACEELKQDQPSAPPASSSSFRRECFAAMRDAPPTEPAHEFTHNPAHPVGTCAKCGEEMVYNVPRLGPDGGHVHKATGHTECEPAHERAGETAHLSPGWVPTYSDPDNAMCKPEAEPVYAWDDAVAEVARELWRDSNGDEYPFKPNCDAGQECLKSARRYIAIIRQHAPAQTYIPKDGETVWIKGTLEATPVALPEVIEKTVSAAIKELTGRWDSDEQQCYDTIMSALATSAREDTEFLDWVEQNKASLVYLPSGDSGWSITRLNGTKAVSRGKSVRLAIRAARSAKED